MGLTLTQAASGGPVTVDQVKTYIGIDSADWDSMLADFIDAATAHVQTFLGKAIGSQEWVLSIDRFADEIPLPLGPVTAVGAITYLDMDRAEQTLGQGLYILDLVSTPQRIVRDPDQSWPDTAKVPNAVSIAFTTGFQSAPAQVVQAIKQTVANWYRDREMGLFPPAAEQLLLPLRTIRI